MYLGMICSPPVEKWDKTGFRVRAQHADRDDDLELY